MARPETSARGGAIPRPGVGYYITAFMALATLAIVTVILGAWFWLTRPVNLGPQTDRLADVLEKALVDNYVPKANIVRSPAVPEAAEREGRKTRWTFHEFTVTLPAELNPDGFKEQLRKDMSTHIVKLLDKERDAETQNPRVSLFIENLPFAELTIVPGTPEAASPFRSDLRNSSTFLADLLEAVLTDLGNEATFARLDPEAQEDLNALWLLTRFTAKLPEGITLGDLAGRLEARNTLPDVTISTDPALEPGACLLMSIAGKPCVSLSCSMSAPLAPERPGPATMAEALEDRIDGSDPVDPLDPAAAPAPAENPPETAMAETPVELATEYNDTEAATESAPLEPPQNPLRPAQIAIIIDDGGNNLTHAERILALDNRLTLAILPNTPFAAETAERGAALGFEIMLHMPMETESATEVAVEDTLFTAMGKEEIQKKTRAALDQIPGVVGVNNHTGSKFTQNKAKMEWFLDVLTERNLFFVDSVTTSASVAFETAREKGVPAARRDVFLDHDTAEEQVQAQFKRLIEVARAQGSAIGIGHFQSPATARVLAAEIPKLEDANITLVHASELVQ